MRRAEGMQFGSAWLSNETNKPMHRKCDLLIRLSEHGLGKLNSDSWQKLQFDSVKASREASLKADLYSGYGRPIPASVAKGHGLLSGRVRIPKLSRHWLAI